MTWKEIVTAIGYADAELIGQGMESVVVRLGDGLVGKVWTHRKAGELLPIQAFYAELAAQGLPFATPEIVEIREHAGTAVSVERELTGTSLKTALHAGALSIPAAQDATVRVVEALRHTSAGAATRALPVLDEERMLSPTLPALVSRRAERFRDPLSAAIPDFDRTLQRVIDDLTALPPAAGQIVHGDICPENILVDEAGEVTALLDWGFLTMAGDNTFDAATAAGFFDMYGRLATDFAVMGLTATTAASRHDETLLARFEKLGHSRDRMLLYRAAYGFATANAYSPEGSDGHFAWCVRNVEAYGQPRTRS